MKRQTIPLIGGPGDGMEFEFCDLQPGQRPPAQVAVPYQGAAVVDWVPTVRDALASGCHVAYYVLSSRVDALVETEAGQEVCSVQGAVYVWVGLGERFGGEKVKRTRRRRRKP